MSQRLPTDEAAQVARRRSLLAVFALAALALIWGYSWVVTKVALRSVQPLTFAAMRISLGALTLFLLLVLLRRPLRPKAVGWTVAVGLLQMMGFFVFSTLALQSGGAGRTVVLTYTMPFWLLLAWAFLGERPAALDAVGMASILVALAMTSASQVVARGREGVQMPPTE